MKVFELLIGTSTFDGAEYLHFLESRLLMEVVLHTPIEAVLGPYIKAAPSEAVQKWLQTNFKNWLMKSPVDLYRLPYLPVNADEKQKKAYGFQDLYDIRMSPDTQTKLEHAMDFFRANPGLTRLDRMTFEQVLAAADAQVEASKRAAMKSAHLAEPETDAQTIMEFPGGYRMVELLTQKALDREGGLMDHCIGSMHGQYLRAGTHRMFSLRDSENQPHATVEITKDDMRSREIKGKGNRPPVRRYWPMLRAFIEKLGIQTHNDYMNVGYLQISNPENGEPMTMTQDQFKDMVLDPDNQQGTQFLTRLGSGEFSSNQLNFHHRRRHDDNDDLMLGLFTALYGSDRMTDGLIQHVFSRMPTHAIQVVEAHGNRLTPDQLMGAFMSIGGGDLEQHYKALIIASKPNVDIVRQIIPELSKQRDLDRDGKPRAWSEKADEFVTALYHLQPDVYGEYLKQGGPEVVESELQERGDRAAGPYFVFAATGGLTPLMVQKAFRAFPGEAFRRAKKLNLQFTPDLTVAAFNGLSEKYWGSDDNRAQFFDLFVPYAKPDAETTKRIFSEIIGVDEDEKDSHRNNRENEFAADLLVAFRKHVPESVDKDTMEAALVAINIDKGMDEYLAVEPNPGVEFQRAMFKRSLKRETGQVRGIQNVDPSLYPMTVVLLKAEEPKRSTTTTQYVHDKKTGKNALDKHGNPRKYEKTEPLKPEEIAKDKADKRGTALTTFTRMFGQIVRLPGPAEAPIDMSAPKFLAAKKWFEENGYGKLFSAAVRKVGRSNAFHNMVGQNNYNSRGDRTVFANHLPNMSPHDIVHVIGGSFSYREDWFGDVVNITPEKVPGVIMASLKPGRYGRQPTAAYGKMDFKGLDKEKTFRSLEHVWASTIVPEGIKDAYTALCFKRFKPNKEILIDMLDRAGSEDAVAYVVKKTKNPSPELIQFLIDNDYAGELLEIKKVLPVDVLKQVFEKYPKIARMLMHRDLRGYGTDETRRKWVTKKFRDKLDRNSDAFKQYEAAAKAAGKADEFAVYARHAELEDMHDEIVPFDQTKREHTVNLDLVKKHLKDFSVRSLKHFIEHDDGKVTKLLFTKLPVEKIAKIIQAGAFKANHWHQQEQGKRDKIIQWMEETDPTKVREAAQAALPHEEAWAFIERLLNFGSKFDEDFIYNAVTNGKPVNGYRSDEPYKKLIRMSNSDKLKNWIADNDPGEMDEIKMPTPHMVDVLFDKYGNFSKSYKGHYAPSSSFSSAVLSWFNKKDGSRYDFEYMPNPAAMKLLHAAAMKRGYTAAAITRAMFQYIARLRNKQSKAEFSVLHNDPVMSPLARSLAPSDEDR